MDTNELVTVYSVSNEVEAQIIKNALQAQGIRAFIEGGNQAGDAGLAGIAIRIQVPAEDAADARRFLEQHEKNR